MTSQSWHFEEQLSACKYAIASNELQRAKILAQELVLANPMSVDAYNLLGNVVIRSGDTSEAARWFNVSAQLDQNKTISPRLNHAMALEMVGRAEEAFAAYQSLRQSHPNNQKIAEKYTRSLFRRDEYSECLLALNDLEEYAFDTYYMRGRCRLELGQSAKAVTDFREALNLRPAYPEALKSLGQGLAHIGRINDALAILLPMQAQQPEDEDLNYTLGRIYSDRGELEKAKDFLAAAIPGEMHQYKANCYLGITYRRLGLDADAVPYLASAVDLKPDNYLSFDHLGEALSALGRHEELRTMVISVLDTNPDCPAIWNGACIFLKTAGEKTLSLEYAKKAVAKYPDQPVILSNLAHGMNELAFAEESKPFAKCALLLKPDYAKAWNALCVSHCMSHNHADARKAVDRALLIDKDLSTAWLNVGVLERSAGRFTEAVAAMRHGIHLNREDWAGQISLAYTLLMAGEVEQGFRQYDKRWNNPGFPSTRRPFSQKIWEGQKLPHHGLLIYMEQGMGDEIMFAWYMRWVAQRTSEVLVECDRRLVDLFKRSFPNFNFVAWAQPPASITKAQNLHYKTPSGHIPKHFWFELRQLQNNIWPIATRSIVRTTGYLTPDPDRRVHWRKYLDSFEENKLRIGICWRSSIHNRARDEQYLKPEEIGQCFGLGFLVVNLQYDHTPEETHLLEEVGRERGYKFVTPPGIDLRDDLDDLTALCAECDIVVTPMISTAFMAGAVGTPTWVFRSSDTGRIWQQLGTPFVPWFPSMRLFFRFPSDPWSLTIEKMRQALDKVGHMDPACFRTIEQVTIPGRSDRNG
jgi:tetratricopeptide (TPR) repeat protein